MKGLILAAAFCAIAAPALAQTEAPRPLPPGSFHFDGARMDLKSFKKPTPVTVDGLQPAPTRPETPQPRAPEPEKKPEKAVG